MKANKKNEVIEQMETIGVLEDVEENGSGSVLSEESANAQFEILADYYDFNIEDSDDVSDLQGALKFAKRGVIRGIQKGLIEIFEDDKGDVCVRQNLQHPIGEVTELIYSPATALIRSEIDSKKVEGESKSLFLMGRLCKRIAIVQSLKGGDAKRMKKLAEIFLI